MERIDAMTAPYSVVPVNKIQSSYQRGAERVVSREGGTQTVTQSSSNQAAIQLTDSIFQTENEDMVDPIDEKTYDRQLAMTSLGTPSVNVIPHTKSSNLDVSREMSATDLSINLFDDDLNSDDDDEPIMNLKQHAEFMAKIRKRSELLKRNQMSDYVPRSEQMSNTFSRFIEPDVDPDSKIAQRLLRPPRTPPSNPALTPIALNTNSPKWLRRGDEGDEKSTERYGYTGSGITPAPRFTPLSPPSMRSPLEKRELGSVLRQEAYFSPDTLKRLNERALQRISEDKQLGSANVASAPI